MTNSENLDKFLNKLLDIVIPNLGGASSGILGTTSGDATILNSIKKSAGEFAQEYRSPDPDVEKLKTLSDELSGYLVTLNVMSVISTEELNGFSDALELLVSEAYERKF